MNFLPASSFLLLFLHLNSQLASKSTRIGMLEEDPFQDGLPLTTKILKPNIIRKIKESPFYYVMFCKISVEVIKKKLSLLFISVAEQKMCSSFLRMYLNKLNVNFVLQVQTHTLE